MAGSKISTTVTDTVLLGSGSYPAPLTISATGAVDPVAFGATGVFADAADVRLVNKGQVTGGTGDTAGGAGGIGVDLRSGGDTLSNTGSITGGNATAPLQAGDAPGNGGDGVDITSGTIGNTGEIIGGDGGGPANGSAAGNGGNGVSLDSSSLSNGGTIAGGAAGNGLGSGGTGVGLDGSGSFLRNTGLVMGGTGGVYSAGGTGVSVASGDTLVNAGMIMGGNGGGAYSTGGAGLALDGGRATNLVTIFGGTGGYNGSGGNGVVIDGGTLTNFGTIEGGFTGPVADGYYGAAYGQGIYFGADGGTLIMEPGAVVHSSVYNAGSGDDIVRLAGIGGTLGIGNLNLDAFGSVIVNAKADWSLTSFNSLGANAALHDLGTLTIAAGAELVSFVGTAAVFIGPAATLSVLGTLAVQRIHFSPDGGTLAIGTKASLADPGSHVTSTLTGFTSGDVIDVAKIATSLSFSGGTLTLEHGTSVIEKLALAGDYTTENFHLAPDQHGGTDVTFVPTASVQPIGQSPHTHSESSVGMMTLFHGHLS